jgi:hypothetical protein
MEHIRETTQVIIENLLTTIPSITVLSNGTPSKEIGFIVEKIAYPTIREKINMALKHESSKRGLDCKQPESGTGLVLTFSKGGYIVVLGIVMGEPIPHQDSVGGTIMIEEIKRSKKKKEEKKSKKTETVA